jgi:DUF4097 and DUF4098 domain-containing protein YvlB
MEYTRSIERSFPMPAGGLVRIQNRRGETVIRGEDRDDIVVTAQIRINAMTRQEAEDRFDAFALPMRESERSVEIGPPRYDEPHPAVLLGFSFSRFVKGPRLDLLVRVPREIEVEAENQTGTLRLDGIVGRCSLGTQRGTVEALNVEGELKIEGKTGRLEARHIKGPLKLEARSGKVTVEDVRGDVGISTSTGSVKIADVVGECQAKTRTGRIRLHDIDGPMQLQAKTGSVEYTGRMVHDANIRVRTGAVVLAITRDSAFFIDAETRTGPVSADLPVNYLEKPPDDAATVRVRTTTGSIRIRLA